MKTIPDYYRLMCASCSFVRVKAVGARGGAGGSPINTLLRSPVYIEGQVDFNEGDQIMVVVGQAGHDSCYVSFIGQINFHYNDHDVNFDNMNKQFLRKPFLQYRLSKSKPAFEGKIKIVSM